MWSSTEGRRGYVSPEMERNGSVRRVQNLRVRRKGRHTAEAQGAKVSEDDFSLGEFQNAARRYFRVLHQAVERNIADELDEATNRVALLVALVNATSATFVKLLEEVDADIPESDAKRRQKAKDDLYNVVRSVFAGAADATDDILREER